VYSKKFLYHCLYQLNEPIQHRSEDSTIVFRAICDTLFLCLRHDKLAGGGIMFSVVRQSVRWIVIVVKLMIETNKPIMMQIGTLSGSMSKGIKGQRCG